MRARKEMAADGGKEGSQKKKEAQGDDYIVLDAIGAGGSVKKSEKKQDFANARDPNYRSLMGVDDKFEPSNKKK